MDICDLCLNLVPDEDGSMYCARAPYMDEDDTARFMNSGRSASCPYYEPGDEYTIVKKQN